MVYIYACAFDASSILGVVEAQTGRGQRTANPDREIGRQAVEEYWAGYASRGPLYASILLDIVREHEALLKDGYNAPPATLVRRLWS